MKNYEVCFLDNDSPRFVSYGIFEYLYGLPEKKEITLEELKKIEKINIFGNDVDGKKCFLKHFISCDPSYFEKLEMKNDNLEKENKYLNDQLIYYKSLSELIK